MRMTSFALCLCLLTVSVGVAAADQKQTDQKQSAIKKEHPGDTALSETEDGSLVYKSFPDLLALYTYAGDTPGKSNCNSECVSGWPPLAVSAAEKSTAVGDWTVILRKDGTRQWAYKGMPVYTRYHNMPFDPASEKEGFRPLKP
jgi:predicted lipoprotein with Yx(FWY)xxD motif